MDLEFVKKSINLHYFQIVLQLEKNFLQNKK